MGHLFVIPARDAPVAVILRRGPSNWYHVIRWDMRHDRFEHGAWIKGRIYEDKCDLSTDGELFIYFVHQGSRGMTAFTHAWTAISRAPWLHALVLWPEGSTWGGGGRFVGPRTISGVSQHGTHPDFPFPKGRLRVARGGSSMQQRGDLIVPTADWSGYDSKGNIIYTQGHVLFRRTKGKDIVVADFSGLKPDPKPAPDWATRPL